MSAPTSDPQMLRNYLLGRTTDAESEAIELDYFAHERSLDLVSAAEHELIDDSLSGKLDPQDQQGFERHYLATAAHRRRVAVARALRDRASQRGRLQPLGRFTWIAALVVIGVVSAVYFVPWMRSTRLATIALPAVSLRDAGVTPTLTLESGVREVELRLERGAAVAHAPFQVRLRTVEGQEIWRGPAVEEPNGYAARVPPSRLPAGDYVVILTAGTEEIETQRYFFRVARP